MGVSRSLTSAGAAQAATEFFSGDLLQDGPVGRPPLEVEEDPAPLVEAEEVRQVPVDRHLDRAVAAPSELGLEDPTLLKTDGETTRTFLQLC